MTNKKLKRRENPTSYPQALRQATDSLSDGYMLKLKQSDPKAYEWMLHFLEAEYGGNAKQYYRSKKQRRRCNSLVNDAKSDAMNYAKSGTGCRLPSDLSHEDTVNELIDLRHVINAEEVEAKPKRKKKKSCDG